MIFLCINVEILIEKSPPPQCLSRLPAASACPRNGTTASASAGTRHPRPPWATGSSTSPPQVPDPSTTVTRPAQTSRLTCDLPTAAGRALETFVGDDVNTMLIVNLLSGTEYSIKVIATYTTGSSEALTGRAKTREFNPRPLETFSQSDEQTFVQ